MTRRQNTLQFSDAAAFDAFQRSRAGFVDVPVRAPYELAESEISKAVAAALDKHPLVAWHARQNTAAGVLIRYADFERLVAAGALTRRDGRFIRFGWKGQLDRTGQLTDGRRLDVEVKRVGEKPTSEQQATIDAVNGARGVAFVARGVLDVFKALGGG